MANLMTAAAFAAKAKDIAENYKTSYMLGPWGWPTTDTMIKRACADATNGTKNKTWLSYANAIKGKGFLFDCVGLIKGILWGWSGNLSKSYGGAGYACNGVPDYGADTMITKCSGVSTDFSGIVPGEVVWMSGHIGIYIGEGIVVESTPKWNWGVQKSTCTNVSSKQISGTVGSRKWTKHGKLPWINYTGTEASTPSGGTAVSGTAASSTKVDAAKGFDKTLAGAYKVTATALNIRAGAGTNKAILGTLPKGTTVRCYGYYTAVGSTKWLYVVANGITGFVSSSYLQK